MEYKQDKGHICFQLHVMDSRNNYGDCKGGGWWGLSTPCNGFLPGAPSSGVVGVVLSTPCNGFRLHQEVARHCQGFRCLSTPCNGFVTSTTDVTSMKSSSVLSTPCNGFFEDKYIVDEKDGRNFQLHVMDSLVVPELGQPPPGSGIFQLHVMDSFKRTLGLSI